MSSVTITIKTLEKEGWFKVVKVFFYAAVSMGLAWLPAHFAHNVQYLALVAPINAVLVGLKQLVSAQAQKSLNDLPVGQQEVVGAVVNTVETKAGVDPSNEVVPTLTAPDVTPAAPAEPTTSVATTGTSV